MFVKHWMTKNPVTVKADAYLDRALQLMKENRVSRLPVIDDQQRVVGMLTKGDCLRVSPSPASMLSKQEANYLLGKLKVSEVMSKYVLCASPDDLVEDVSAILRDNKIEGLPVTENGRLVGIITKTDIFEAFMDIMGAGGTSTRLILEAEDRCGVLADVSQTFKNHGIVIESVAKIHRNEHNKVYLLLRFKTEPPKKEAILKELAQRGYTLESVVA